MITNPIGPATRHYSLFQDTARGQFTAESLLAPRLGIGQLHSALGLDLVFPTGQLVCRGHETDGASQADPVEVMLCLADDTIVEESCPSAKRSPRCKVD